MVQVILKRDWFAPDGRLYRAGGKSSTTSIPDRVAYGPDDKSMLPADAKVVDRKIKQPEVPAESDLARDHDPARVEANAVQKRLEQLDASKGDPATESTGDTEADDRAAARATKRKAIQAQLEAEKKGKK